MSLIDDIKRTYSLNDTFDSMVNGKFDFQRIVIKKRNGRPRIIYVPIKEVKIAQIYILQTYLQEYLASPFATAYENECSIVKNACLHEKQAHYCFLDIHHFFDSISLSKLETFLICNSQNKRFAQLSSDDRDFLFRMISYNDKIYQGSITSPHLANIYLSPFDKDMNILIKKMLPNGKYTRYSDDIVISSSENIPYIIVTKVSHMLSQYGLKLNSSKTHFTANSDHVKITGINLCSNEFGIKHSRPTVNTKFKKELKHDLYRLIFKKDSFELINHVEGCMYYLKMVQPSYYKFLNKKYQSNGKDAIEIIKEYQRNNEHK